VFLRCDENDKAYQIFYPIN